MKKLVIVRGGGDIATACIHKLFRCGFPVLVLETPLPSAIRREVAFSQAVYVGEHCVEGQTAQLISQLETANVVLGQGKIPIFLDPQGKSIQNLRPAVVVDGILAKKNLGTSKALAPLTIALGPGFEAGVDVDFVVETNRGHDLGRIIQSGYAEKNTGLPGEIKGISKERVMYAPVEGTLELCAEIGDFVEKDEIIAYLLYHAHKTPVKASISGVLRGILPEGYPVYPGLKLADIDPRKEEKQNCFTISDKARCIAGSVLELVLAYGNI